MQTFIIKYKKILEATPVESPVKASSRFKAILKLRMSHACDIDILKVSQAINEANIPERTPNV